MFGALTMSRIVNDAKLANALLTAAKAYLSHLD